MALQDNGAPALHVRCMNELTRDAIREIEQIHSSWIEFEVAGQWNGLMGLCADDIELWPPDERPLLGRTTALAHLAHGTTRLHSFTALRLTTVVFEVQTRLRT